MAAPSVFPLRPCCASIGSESTVTVGCLAKGYLPELVTFQWGNEFTSKTFPATYGSNGLYSRSSQLTLSREEWKRKPPTCSVSHSAMQQPKNVTFSETDCISDPLISESRPQLELLADVQQNCATNPAKMRFVCFVSGLNNNNVRIIWSLGNSVRDLNPMEGIRSTEDSKYCMTSKVEIPSSDWNSYKSVTCKITGPGTGGVKPVTATKCTASRAKRALLVRD